MRLGALRWWIGLILVPMLSSCAVLEIERNGEVIARRVSLLTGGALPELSTLPRGALLVSRERVLGLSVSDVGTYLGFTQALKVNLPDLNQCAMVIWIDPSQQTSADWTARLKTLLPQACVFSTQ